MTVKHNKIMYLVLLLALFVGTPTAYAADKMNVVIQVSDNDPAKWNLALNNARNIRHDLGKDTQIEIVAYGPGINMFKFESEVGNRLDEAKANGIGLEACENTMKAQKLKRDDMHKAVSYVPAGVVEIMKREKEGWAYIRP
jgi:intracellular sulfur oxidation DsrE/DsrF family protein